MTNEPIEGEFTETHLARVEPQQGSVTVFGTDDPVAIVQRVADIATPLARFIRERGMTTNMGGRTHVNIEGWSFMGAMMGIAPVVTRVSELRDADDRLCGFEAQVELRTRDGAVVGGGIGECSRSETMWGWEPKTRNGNPLPARDDFALKSMAQTRATGKAYRLAFGFIMKAAGYDATPAEEMPENHDEVPTRTVEPPRPRNAQNRPVDASNGQLFENGGQLLTSALNYLHMNRAEVLLILDAESIADVTDYSAAWEKLVAQKEAAGG
jgi:hypothetical protein